MSRYPDITIIIPHMGMLNGCDYPYGMPADNLRRVQRLQIPDEEKALMLGGNVMRLARDIMPL